MGQKQLRHPEIPVHVHVAESGQDKFSGGINDLSPFRDPCLPPGTYDHYSIAFDDNDRIGERPTSRPVDQGAALDHQTGLLDDLFLGPDTHRERKGQGTDPKELSELHCHHLVS